MQGRQNCNRTKHYEWYRWTTHMRFTRYMWCNNVKSCDCSSHWASKLLQFCADGNLHFSCKCHSRRLLGQHWQSSQASKCIPLDLGSRRKKRVNLRELEGWISLNIIWFLQACSSSSTLPEIARDFARICLIWMCHHPLTLLLKSRLKCWRHICKIVRLMKHALYFPILIRSFFVICSPGIMSTLYEW